MTVDPILSWMESTALAQAVLNNAWVFPVLETLHFVGLILLLGSLYVIDLRFVGLAARIPLRAVMALVPIALLGFLINFSTGILFLFADPFRYYPNLAFRLKMLAVLLAGLNALWFKLSLDERALSSEPFVNPGARVRWIAGISLVLWTAVIVLGRLIPYL